MSPEPTISRLLIGVAVVAAVLLVLPLVLDRVSLWRAPLMAGASAESGEQPAARPAGPDVAPATGSAGGKGSAGNAGKHRKLTPEEERVIVHKGTEAPFTGEYNNTFAAGIYACRRCGAMLYRSKDKFRSHCGWPSFDDEIAGAVKRVPDADGRRTEILCSHCGGHLGHVFLGEQQTAKNTRHCVNSLSLTFLPEEKVKYGRAVFAGGCFWGVEYWLRQQSGVLRTTVGYTGGTKENPTYEEVCRHATGHLEAVEVLYDPVRVSFEDLAKLFFEIHDPTQANGQGPDIGEQYLSVIFTSDAQQKQVVEKLIGDLKAKGLKVVTRLLPAGKFWPAEEYHQEYYAKKGSTPYCHVRRRLW